MSAIATRAVLASVHLTALSSAKKDDKITNDVLSTNHATASKRSKWSTDLWPNGALEPITQLHGQIRRYFTSMTLPWADSGTRLLPQAKFMEYSTELQQFSDKLDHLVDAFIANYDTHVRAARVQNGAMFRPEFYPTAAVARQRFSFASDIQPVPVIGDFRIAASESEIKEMEASLAAKIERAAKLAEKELVDRITEPLAKIVDKLKNPPEDGKKVIFRDTLIDNVREIVREIPAYNLSDNPVLTQVATMLQTPGGIATMSPDALRESRELQTLAVSQAESFLGQLQSIFGDAA
jgi:hypothetical protein